MMPATIGALTDVPVCPSVQRWRRSVVIWRKQKQDNKNSYNGTVGTDMS